MPRQARVKSTTGIYHVMVRGIARMPIFHDAEDHNRYLDTLVRINGDHEYELLTYCLMDNHVHLLLREGKDSVERSMKRISVSYAYYYNRKYDRVGHLFQDRFRSEGIQDDAYFLAVARYIHNNPVKARIVEKAEGYQWSSYRTYLGLERRCQDLVNTMFLLGMLTTDPTQAIARLRQYTEQEDTDSFIDVTEGETDLAAAAPNNGGGLVEELLQRNGVSLPMLSELQDKQRRNQIIREIKETTGLSNRELARILGIGRGVILRV